jgi:hypothetical protein
MTRAILMPTTKMAPMRSLREIRRDITGHWKHPGWGPSDALWSMQFFDNIDEMHCGDQGRDVVKGFLSHAGNFRGPDAERLKAELKALLRTVK